MNIIKINKTNYYKVDDIIVEYSDFNKGCKTIANIIKRHKLSGDDYIYTRLTKNKWIVAEGKNKKFDKFFVTSDWFDENFGEEELEEIKDDTEDAPPIIKLKENEKFFDNDGNVVEIEVRGERDIEKCYFKVSDISKGFDLPKIHDTIIVKNTLYEENEHYIYFYCNKNKKNRKLFLTHKGMFEIISKTRKLCSNRINHNTLYLWFLNLCNPNANIFNNKIHTINNKINDAINRGYVYCAYSNIIDGVKIGYWRSTLDSLRSRYVTYYGNNVIIETVETFTPNIIENKTHKKFYNMNITNELFDKKYLDDYISYIKKIRIKKFNGYHISDKIDYSQLDNDQLTLVDNIGNTLNDNAASIITYIYLFAIGTVGEYRDEYDIDESHSDDKILAKYGKN